MARSKGSMSSDEAKEICAELEQLFNTPFKYNFNYLRMIELLVVQRITEQVCKFPEGTPTYALRTKVEIPLFGTLEIIPEVTTRAEDKEPKGLHLNFSFSPSSGFKADVLKSYSERNSDIPDVFADIYGERLQELYNKLKGGAK